MKKKQEINIRSLVINRRYLIFSGIGILVVLMVVFLGIIPQVNNLLDMRREIDSGQERLSILRQKTIDLENIEAREAYDSLESVNRLLPSKKPLLELLTALDLVSGKNNVTFVDLSLSPGKIASESAEFLDVAKTTSRRKKIQSSTGDGYDSLVVELEIFGLFNNVQQFFLDIEKVAPLTTITSLSLDIKSDNIIRPSDEVQAEVVLGSYYFTQSVAAGLGSSLPNIGNKEREIIEEIKNYLYPTINVQKQIEMIDNGTDSKFIAESVLMNIEKIKKFRMSSSVKQNRINFFATIV
jgi:hypothetical protein